MAAILRELEEQLKTDHTALIIIDVQNDFCSPDGAMAKKLGVDVSRINSSIPHLNALIEEARKSQVLVVWVRVAHTLARMLPNKRLLRAEGEDVWPVKEGTWGAGWYEKVSKPLPDEPVVTKFNYDAFADTELELLLRAREIKTVVTAGYLAEVCVETTARSAFIKGYYVVVPEECTDSYSEEAYRASLSTLDRYFGRVVPAGRIAKLWVKAKKK